MGKRIKGNRLAMVLACVVLLTTACSSVDCPLNNTVYANFKLMGKVSKLSDELTISTHQKGRKDSILINRLTNAESFSIPVSYGKDVDTLVILTNTITDTVWIEKTNRPHFESVDCGLNYFHTITGVRSTRNAIESIVINQKEITYDASQQHFHIYFKEYRF